jgi:GTPase
MANEERDDRGSSASAGDRPVDGAADGASTRCGFVAIVGRPNAGKSTLLNQLLGEHLSIVTPLAQTTWVPVTGILTRDGAQAIFLDTPGLLSDPKDLLHRSLLEAVAVGVRDADVVLLLLDPDRPADAAGREVLAAAVRAAPGPALVAVNKCDRAPEGAVAREEAWSRDVLGVDARRISASTGEGVEALWAAIAERLPPGPFLYPEDDVATAPVRFFVGELVREAVFETFRQEIPWSVLPRVEDFRDPVREGDRTYIGVTLHVERASQKGILIGEGGRTIREVGTAARARIEAFLGTPVYLELWVKVLPRWRKKRGELRRMGLPVPDDPGRTGTRP